MLPSMSVVKILLQDKNVSFPKKFEAGDETFFQSALRDVKKEVAILPARAGAGSEEREEEQRGKSPSSFSSLSYALETVRLPDMRILISTQW